MTDAVKAAANGLRPAARGKRPAQTRSMGEAVKARSQSRDRSPSRVGRKGIVIYVEPEVATAIHRLAASFENGTVQTLGEHALRLLFAKYREPWPGRAVG